jgi:DNA-binding MarR family transcriptional regulator
MPNEAMQQSVSTEAAALAAVLREEPIRPGFGRCLATDELGRLFDPNFRQLLARRVKARMPYDAETMANLEAAAAMGTASKAMQQFFEDELEEFGISHAQYKVLAWIRECGKEGTHLNQIADSLRVTPRNVTGLIDSLETQGLVERVPDPRDRRATVARLTPEGDARVGAAWRTHQRNLRELLAVLSDDEKQLIRHAALKLIRALEARTPRRKTNG